MTIIKSNSLLHFCEEDAGFGEGAACFDPYIFLARDPRADGHFSGLETKPGTFCPSTAITALA